jgi:chitinase
MNRIALIFLFCLLMVVSAFAQNTPAWAPQTHYSVGSLVTYSGVTYSCLQAHTSEIGWEPAVTLALWQPVNPKGIGACSTAPGVPGGLSASATTSNSTTLGWNAAAVAANCSVTAYTIYQNGAAIGTATGKGFTVTGLAPATTYQFTVAAGDGAGASGQSAPVKVTTAAAGSGSGCAPAWDAGAVYTGGMTASLGGVNYVANWWTQGQNPNANSGGPGTGQPWTVKGTCAVCSAAPGVPVGLSASGTTGYSTVLTWPAAGVPANCTVTQYTILNNGSVAGNTAGTTFTALGLSPQTAYSFAVEASDAAGTSAPGPSITVTTGSAPVSGGGTRTFAPYIDMSITSDEDLAGIQRQSGINLFTLAFILSNGGCAPGWGGVGSITNDTLPNGVSMQTLIQNVRAAGADVIISFGGAFGTELAQSCTDVASLQAAYQAVINRYNAKMLDFDVEGASVMDQASITRRNQALVRLKAANPGLVVSYTLPVLPAGLVDSGVNILRSAKADGLNLDLVNVMAMDYGPAVDNGGQMGLDAIQAAGNTHQQILAAGLAAAVGVIPMIGVNDTAREVFQLADAQALVAFANANSYITRLSMWSVARDNGSCAGTGWASPTCSGIAQSWYQFSSIFQTFR